MKPSSIKPVRCAIYTRVSTEHGLDQEFNSLDAQYDAASAYIKSQAHAGWTLIRSRYDDGGYSGGSTDRPDLQRLLDDIRSRKIDVIVVYKVDRLTRSLADFAKLVELFDAHGVSFVSVTQQFNTTTSMGRLTLNVLLSFAQFEREVTSERIRDKIAASKRKGLWVGGPLPLGYQMKDGKIAVVEDEAERVRLIFRRYLELGGVNALVRDLRERNIRTKQRPLATGVTRGGVPFGRGSLFYLLRNHFYIGEVKYKDEILPGEQPPVLDRALFDAVQQKLTDQWTTRSTIRNASDHLLTGLLFDAAGYRMVPTHAKKAGVRYRYYVSVPHLHGESKTASVGSVSRVPAPGLEEIVVKTINAHLVACGERPASTAAHIGDGKVVTERAARIDLHEDRLVIRLKSADGEEPSEAADENVISIPWQKPPSRRSRQILIPHGVPQSDVLPTRIERRARLVSAIAGGRRWLDQIVSGSVTANREASEMQRASGQHDDFARVLGTGSRQGGGRRSAAARHWGRPTT